MEHPTQDAVKRQLARILASSQFSHAERLAAFLSYVVERAAEGKREELKETVIGLEVFGRAPGYNPKTDPIVRVQAARLRKKLRDYYSTHDRNGELVIDIPKGGYVPRWRDPETNPAAARRFLLLRSVRFRIAVALVVVATASAGLGWWWARRESAPRPSEEVTAKGPSGVPASPQLAAVSAVASAQPLDRPPHELTKMRPAAEKAIEPPAAEELDARAMVYARESQWAKAEESFRRAIELDPKRSATYSHFALELLVPLGRLEEALEQLRVAEKADPMSVEVHLALSWVLNSSGRHEEAAGHCDSLPADHPIRKRCLARARLGQGKFDEVIQLQTHEGSGYLGFAYARSGRRDEAERLAAALRHPFHQALVFAGLGDGDRTLEALDRVAALGPQMVGELLTAPELALLVGDPRVKAVRKKVGLPD